MSSTHTNKVLFGTCSWNYPSWKGLVYDKVQARSADYLPQYAKHFRTAEIDSWFYRAPTRQQVKTYANAVDDDFLFTCKAPRTITLTHMKDTEGTSHEENPAFLSPEAFESFLEVLEPMHKKLAVIMLEFEYLNKQKMPSRTAFLDRLNDFFSHVSREIPIGIETRNGNYLSKEYFEFIEQHRLIHVYSEKIYMPHIYDVFAQFGDPSTQWSVIRLMGGDRKDIEEVAGDKWDRILYEKTDKEKIAEMVKSIARDNMVIVNVNNHYEGSAPRTIETFQKLIQ